MSVTDVTTPIIEKLIASCRDRETFWQTMGGLSPRERVAVHDQLWAALVEKSCLGQRPFTREDIVPHMQSSRDYQRRMGCTEPEFVCRRKTCINSNPSCATQKISEHIEILRQQLAVNN
jgi:hypothetical protein